MLRTPQHPSRMGWAIVPALGALFLVIPQRPERAQSPKPTRFDIPFTLSVKSPHIPWGVPSAGTPVHAFVVPSVTEGRNLIELAERLPLQFHTVPIDEDWGPNTYIGFDQNYGSRTYSQVYQYLADDLNQPEHYDVIILPSLLGWNRLPPAARAAIQKRVQEGAGLVLIHPTTGLPASDDPKLQLPTNELADPGKVWPGDELWEISPLVGVLSDRINIHGTRQIRPDAITTGTWKLTSPHFITGNLPVYVFPSQALKHYKYRLGKDATALVVGEGSEPIVAVKNYGKGRVVALGYVNTGLSPTIDWDTVGQGNDHWWEYFYSLLGRSILWAAGHEPRLTLAALSVSGQRKTLVANVENSSTVRAVELAASIIDEWGESEGKLQKTYPVKPGNNVLRLSLPATHCMGRHEVDVILSANGNHYDWGTTSFDVPKSDEIISISTDRHFYTRGDQVVVSFKTQAGREQNSRIELVDNRGRLVGQTLVPGSDEPAISPRTAALQVGNYSTNIGWVRVTLLGADSHDGFIDQKQVRVNFATLDRDFGAYELIMPWGGPPSYQPWIPTLDKQLRQVGLSVFGAPWRNFRLQSELRLSTPNRQWFGVGWNQRAAYIEQKDKFLETGDTRDLIREPDIANDAVLDELRQLVVTDMQHMELFRPIAYYLADESSLTSYVDPLDFSWSPATLTKMRAWLRTQYPTLEALNGEWGSRFASWDEVEPLTTQQAQARGNYAGWMDHRTFMEKVLAHTFEVASDALHRQDPGSVSSISGTQVPGPSNGVNWYLLDRALDYIQPYSGDDQDELHRTMRPGLLMTGFTGYARHGLALRWELWHRLFHGQVGASLFWQFTAVNPDLTLSEQGQDLAETINEFRNEGLALLLRNAQRENCGIAVHYSLLSLRGEWITDGHIQAGAVVEPDGTSAHLRQFHSNRHAWLQALEDAGYQYDFLTTEQIDQGGLGNYRVLVLPDSIALTDAEAEAIHKFVIQGGLLLADTEVGLMDGHGRWRATGGLDDVLGVKQGPGHTVPREAAAKKIRVDLEGHTLGLDVIPADPMLAPTTGHPAAQAEATPVLIDQRFGQGRAVLLNFWMTDYLDLRKAGRQDSRLDLLREILSQAGISPIVEARASTGKLLACSESIAYRQGEARYLAIIPAPYGSGGFPNARKGDGTSCADPSPITLQLSQSRYAYNLKNHEYLGHVSRLSSAATPGDPLVYALEPSPIGKLSIVVMPSPSSRAPGQVQAGGTVRFSIQLVDNADPAVQDIPAHVDVRNPAGEILDYYAANLLLKQGKGEFVLPLALDDSPGIWQVEVREPFTHQTASARFVVTR